MAVRSQPGQIAYKILFLKTKQNKKLNTKKKGLGEWLKW
jgi:hypothetical protein